MPLIQALYPTYIKLQNACVVNENDEQTLKEMKTKAKVDLDKRYSAPFDIYLIASFLHPRTKDLKFVSDRDRSEIHDKVKLQMCEISAHLPAAAVLPSRSDVTSTDDVITSHNTHENTCDDDYMDWMDDIISPGEVEPTECTTHERVNREMLLYISEPATKTNPLCWWAKMEPVFPHLSKLAKKYLCVPASSVPAERIFSTAGHLVNRRRAALSPDNVNMLIFLNKNIGKL